MAERKPNRLIHEKSPYLRQHAFQPVDWYPWGEEAFTQARLLDRPIFLSIGYSTCHWCHVMAEETFENEEIAQLMNETFVSIKVDREERPDIDHTYMEVAQILTGSGGWPLSIVMTPEGIPFFAGTYFPPYSRFGILGMKDLILRIRHLWTRERRRIEESSREIFALLARPPVITQDAMLPDVTLLHKTLEALRAVSDREWGGLKGAPKFPLPQNILFLLRAFQEFRDLEALAIAEETLQALRNGGIFDQVGFGFHRYSTDVYWLLPHFEKMLYDQALLALAYTEAFAVTGKKIYREVAEEVFTYVEMNLTSPEGAFYAAEDADSPEGEGAFYLFTVEEIRKVLGENHARLFERVFSLREEGNFPHSRRKNILYRRRGLTEWAEELDFPEEKLKTLLEEGRKKLFTYRAQRPHPSRDEKILTDWNGLMIGALARASLHFQNEGFLLRAKKAAHFFLEKMIDESGQVFHLFMGEPAVSGYLDDYAFLTFGLLELYRASLEGKYLQKALRITEKMLDRFSDPEGGFFFTASDTQTPLLRPQVFHDGAIPSGNSVAVENCLRLSQLLFRVDLQRVALRAFARLRPLLAGNPLGYCYLAKTMFSFLQPGSHVVLVASPDHPELPTILQTLKRKSSSFLFLPEGDRASSLWELLPEDVHFRSLFGKPTFYLCKNFTCEEPTTDFSYILARL
jgi:hypothetical protein